ncbi:hypothetical protein GOODEAATRI_028216 [Goodea atripinnis]|uniref:Uncharacterized protein n=1 Tax=Goodea atripinnis TaxID=208336 RepID=A0ABV0Q1P9_9TELE
MNKKLYDSNDGLRSALTSEAVAGKRRMSPQHEIPARRMKPLRQSTLNHGRSEQNTNIFRVSTWADRYLDSGVSVPMDMAESSVSDYDSDNSYVEILHHSYSCVPSDVELEDDIAVTEEPSLRYRVVLAGDAGAGKSSFLVRLTLNEFKGDIQTTLDKEDAGGRRDYESADMGHSGSGEVHRFLERRLSRK